MENSLDILSCGEYFHCKLSFAYIGTIYFGGGYIPLGILILGWEDGILRDKCSCCKQNTLWITGFSGGFSFGVKWGVCVECKKLVIINCKPSDYIEIQLILHEEKAHALHSSCKDLLPRANREGIHREVARGRGQNRGGRYSWIYQLRISGRPSGSSGSSPRNGKRFTKITEEALARYTRKSKGVEEKSYKRR